jgi:hypothetical protein
MLSMATLLIVYSRFVFQERDASGGSFFARRKEAKVEGQIYMLAVTPLDSQLPHPSLDDAEFVWHRRCVVYELAIYVHRMNWTALSRT